MTDCVFFLVPFKVRTGISAVSCFFPLLVCITFIAFLSRLRYVFGLLCVSAPYEFPPKAHCSSSTLTFWHPGNGLVCTFKDKTYNPGDSWHPYLEPFGLMFCMRCVCTEVPPNICTFYSSAHLKEHCTKLPDVINFAVLIPCLHSGRSREVQHDQMSASLMWKPGRWTSAVLSEMHR